MLITTSSEDLGEIEVALEDGALDFRVAEQLTGSESLVEN